MSNIELPPLPWGERYNRNSPADMQAYARAAVELNQKPAAVASADVGAMCTALVRAALVRDLFPPATRSAEHEQICLNAATMLRSLATERDELIVEVERLQRVLQKTIGMGTVNEYHEPGLGLNKGDY